MPKHKLTLIRSTPEGTLPLVKDRPEGFDSTDDMSIGANCIWNVQVNTMTVGVPAGVNIRVVAEDEKSARARAVEVMTMLMNGTELLQDLGDDDIRPGESCRVYLDPDLLGDVLLIENEGPLPTSPFAW